MSLRTAGHLLTRRQWSAALAAALPLSAQTAKPPVAEKTPPLGTPAPAASGADVTAKVDKATADVHGISDTLRQMEVAIDVAPAFIFRP